MKRKLSALAKAALSVALIAWIFRSLDMASVGEVLRGLSAGTLALAAALVAIQAMVIGRRWHRIVALLGGDLPALSAMRWVFLGMFFNNALPTAVGGDAVRIWLLRKSGQPLALSIGSVAIERGTGIVLLGLMISACMPAVWETMHDPALRVTLASAGPLLLVGLVFAALTDNLAGRWLPSSVAAPLEWLGDGLRQLARQPLYLAEIAALGVFGSITGLLAAYVVGEGLDIGLGLPAYVVLVGGAVLLSVLPISLGGWGVRELGMVALFGAVGVRAERAMALSLIWGLLPLVVSLPAGMLWWLGGKAKPVAGIVIGSDEAQLSPEREMHPPH